MSTIYKYRNYIYGWLILGLLALAGITQPYGTYRYELFKETLDDECRLLERYQGKRPVPYYEAWECHNTLYVWGEK